MICPSCDEHFAMEDYTDDTPFECEYCGQWLKIDIDESTYQGATHTRLICLDEEDIDRE